MRKRHQIRRRRVVAVVAAATCVAAVIGIALWRATPSGPLSGAAEHDVRGFFDGYVNPDGRVVRHDQGGDTVSEGQAYALLLAAAAENRPEFERVWGWTAGHLEQPDGLFAWRWAGGRVTDPQPASDADLLTGWALSVAAARFGDPGYASAARRVAAAILAHDTIPTSAGPVLVAGPWAQASGVVDPSYFAPAAFAALGRLTGDGRWAQLAATSTAGVRELTTAPDRLPPDWAAVSPTGRFSEHDSPQGQPPAYGLDAARIEVFYATGCTLTERAVAAAAWPLLLPSITDFAATRSLDGHPEDGPVSPLMAVAGAATARAAGRATSADHLLADADRLSARYPSYYGAAWVALGRVLLTSTALPGCSIA